VLKDIITNVQEMIRSEIRLARVEMKGEVSHAAGAAKLIGIGAGLALLGAAFLLVTVALLLALVMPAWLATLIVGAALGIGGFVMLQKGRAEFKVPRPNKTIENVKENVEWMKNQSR
jgi:uncharacterized membrane protein YqjE